MAEHELSQNSKEVGSIPNLSINDLFDQEGKPIRFKETGPDHIVVYHKLHEDLLPFIGQYGFYNLIGRSTLSDQVQEVTGRKGSVVVAFNVPRSMVRTPDEKTWTSLSISEEAAVDGGISPNLIQEMYEAGEQGSEACKNTANLIKRMSTMNGIGCIPPDKVDWEETLRATVLCNFSLNKKVAEEMISREGDKVFSHWTEKIKEAQQYSK